MDNVSAPLTKSEIESGFAESFAYQIALGMFPPKEVCNAFGVGEIEWERLRKTKAFRAAVQSYKKEIDEEGVTSKRKAQIAVDAGIEDMVRLWRDPDTPASARVAAFAKVAEIAGVNKPVIPNGSGSGFSLTVILDGDSSQERVVDVNNPPNIPKWEIE